jgi:hypothetical protein
MGMQGMARRKLPPTRIPVGGGTVDFDQRFRTRAKCAHSGRRNEPVSGRRVPTRPPLTHGVPNGFPSEHEWGVWSGTLRMTWRRYPVALR